MHNRAPHTYVKSLYLLCVPRGDVFMEVLMKNPFTYEKQLAALKSKGLKVENDDKCLKFLRSVNYYWFSAYLLPFKQSDGTCAQGLTFEKVHSIFEFDRKLRALIFFVIEEIELSMRSQLAYYFAHKHGAYAYLDKNLYNAGHDHKKFKSTIKGAVHNHRNTPVVMHHNAKYGGKFPIWVIIDFFSLGNLSYFYADWDIVDKKAFAKKLFGATYPFLDSWMKCITVLRNRCAHYSRLYFSMFTDAPKIPRRIKYRCTGRLFDQLIMLQLLYLDKQKWNDVLLLPLKELVAEYSGSVSPEHLGFPDNWQELIEHKTDS